MRTHLFVYCLLVFCMLVTACEPGTGSGGGQTGGNNNSGGGQTSGGGAVAWNDDWDKPFGTPQYLLHATGHGTVDGSVKDDWWFLFGTPPTNGGVLLPDGSGGTFGYSIDTSSGPFNSPSEVCASIPAAAAEASLGAWNGNLSFTCKEINAARNNRGNNPNANNGNPQNNGNNGNAGGNNPPQQPPAQAAMSAWTSCSGFLELDPSLDNICDVCVMDWNSDTSNRVNVDITTPNGITALPGSTSGDATGMHSTGVSDHKEYCFSEIWHVEGLPSGSYTVPIHVWQDGGGDFNLSLIAQVPETMAFGACPAVRSMVITGRGWAQNDWIAAEGFGADGKADLFVNITVTVDDPQAFITDFEQQVTDESGNAITSPVMAWSSTPSGVNPFLGVFSVSANQWLNDPNRSWSVNAGMGSQTASFQLMSSGVYEWLYANNFRLMVTAYFGNNAACTVTAWQ